MREGDVRSPVSGGGGTSASSAWRGNGVARRGRETTEKQPQWYEEGKCASERRRGTEGAPKRGRDAHPV